MHNFRAPHPKFAGFSDYYAEFILPHLELTEAARRQKLSTAIKFGIFFIIMGVVAGLFLYPYYNHPLAFFGPIIASILLANGGGYLALHDIKVETKNHLINNICDFLGWSYERKVAEPPHLDVLSHNKLLPSSYDRSHFEDRFYGELHGADFELIEAHLERRSRNSKNKEQWVTVFRGQLMAIDFHREFMGRTVVLRDKKIFNTKQKAGMKRVGLVDPVFEKIFEAYSTDQVEARYLLTPTFMQRLVDLETSVDGKRIRFAFLNGLLLIVVETKNRYESGSMLKSLTAPDRTQVLLDEFLAIFAVIDGLMEPHALPNAAKS